MNRAILSIALVLSISSNANAAFTDTDGDGLGDGFELGFRILFNGSLTDDVGTPVHEAVSNTYNDTDSDGIPDIVETNILYTDPNINDSTALNYVTDLNGQGGGGTVDNLSGQWDGCVYTSVQSECDSVLIVSEFNATSIMHSSTGQVIANSLIDGFATTASYNTVSNQFTGSYQSDGPLSSFAVTYDDVDTMTGTLTQNGVTNNFILKRRSQLTFTENMSAIIGVQDLLLDNNLNAVTSELNPISTSLQQIVSGADAELYDKWTPVSEAYQGFYAPSVGKVVYIIGESYSGVDLDGDGAADDTEIIADYLGAMSLEAPVGKAGGFFRASLAGGDHSDYNSDGSIDVSDEFEDSMYGTAVAPRLSSYTLNKIIGANTVFNAMNVPMSATQVSLSGGLNVDVVGGSSGNTLADELAIRTRLNPFTDSWDEVNVLVGLSGSGKQNIAKVGTTSTRSNYDDSPAAKLANLAPSGSYTYSFTDSDSSPNAVGSYTQPGSLVDPVNPDGVRINGSLLKPGVPRNNANGLAFDTTISNTISWDPVASATQYDIQLNIINGDQFDDYQSVFRFTTGTSVTIPANTLVSGVGYDMTITTRNGNSNRSRSTEYKINDAGKTTLLNLTSTAEGVNVSGYNAASGGVNFQALLRPGDGSKDIGYILLHGRCNGPEKVVVSTLRRSLASSGAPTLSIANPAPNPDINNDCGAFGSYTDYVNSVNGSDYVMTEAYARVRTAMDYLKNNEGVNRVVLVGFSLGSRLASAAANHADDTVANPVPVVGLILAGGRSGGGAALLDTTNTIAGVTVPVLDIHMVDDNKAFTTAAARQTAHAGSSYTIDAVSTVDTWTVVNNLPENDKFRHQFMGYEDVLRSKVKSWVTSTDLSIPAGTTSADVVIDFGGIGLWARMNDSAWQKLNNSSPDDVITGDVDGNGIDDVIADFGSTFGGIFIKRNGGAWAKLHNSSPQSMATGDLDGNGSDDIVIDFGGIGLWARMNDSAWLKLNNTSPDQIAVTDMDGNGADDVIADFGSTFGGIFVKRNGGAWAKLHNTSPVTMATGDLDGNGSGDVIINFGGIGLWARMNNASWLKLHNGSPDSIVSGDVDGNGADDVVASFGSSFGGVWQKQNLGGWTKLNNNAPDQMVMGDMDANGQSDLIGAFNSTLGGIFVRRNNGAWAKLHNNNPDDLAVGELDGI